MQKRLILLLAVLFSANALLAQTFNVCNGSEVTFEMEDEYWGEPVWQYSTDSLNWESFSFDVTQPFIVDPGMSGYYRLLMVDESCDSTYVSQVERIIVGIPFEASIASVFAIDSITIDTDPYVWIQEDDPFEDIEYHTSTETYPTETEYFPIPNPGDDFLVYATMFHPESGCIITSDTIHFIVYDPTISVNGTVALGDTPLNNLLALSSVDSLGVLVSGNFEIETSPELGIDIIYTVRTNFTLDTQLVAINVVNPSTENIELSAYETALSIVMMDPAISPLIWTKEDSLRIVISTALAFIPFQNNIQEQLDASGYVDIELEDFISNLEALLNEIVPPEDEINGLTGDDSYPQLNADDAVLGMSMSASSTKLFKVARFYENNDPVSKAIAMPGKNWGNYFLIYQTIMNKLMGDEELQQAISTQIRYNRRLTPEDIQTTLLVHQFKTRLVNGRDVNNDGDFEHQLAYDLNMAYFVTHLLMSVPSLLTKKIKESAQSIRTIFSLVKGALNPLLQGEIPSDNFALADAIIGLTSLIFTITGAAAILPTIAYGLAVYSFGKAAFTLATIIRTGFTEEPDVYYLCTKIGPRITPYQLQFQSNSSESFETVPGGYTNIKPSFALKDVQLVYRDFYENPNDIGNLIDEWDAGFFTHLNGITFSGETSFTYSLQISGLGILDNPETFMDGNPLPLDNELSWQANWSLFSPIATLKIQFQYNDELIVNMEGLTGEDSDLYFTCSIKEPEIEIITEINDSGAAGEIICNPCQAQVKTADTGIGIEMGSNGLGSFGVSAEILGGQGAVSDNGSDYSSLISTFSTYENGLFDFWWQLSEGDNQLKLSLNNPEDNGEFTAVLFNVESGLCGTTLLDERDGQTYQIVQIGDQCWMAENLRYDPPGISEVSGQANWAAILNDGPPTGQPAWCYYDDDDANDATYGKLYNWFAVNTGTLCPDGWHISTDADWGVLELELGMPSNEINNTLWRGEAQNVGGKLKSNTGWNTPNIGATNESSFSGLPGGGRDFDGPFSEVGSHGFWWLSDFNNGWYLNVALSTWTAGVGRIDFSSAFNAYSCRCVRD